MTEAKPPSTNRLFWFSVIFCTVYQSYRYPLQINSSGTSPTYADTPFFLQAGKFILTLPLLALAIKRCVLKPARHAQWIIMFAVLFLSGFCLIKSIGDSDPAIFEAAFWMLFSMISAWAVDCIYISEIDVFFKFLLIYSFVSTFIEVTLFVTIGRLPALAYEGTLFVRFGGFLDDPNGFAMICLLLMGWSYSRFTGWLRFAMVTGLVISLLLTQSWTAIIFFFAFLLLWATVAVLRRPAIGLLLICLAIFLCLLVLSISVTLGQFGQSLAELAGLIFAAKQGSADEHVAPLVSFLSGWREWILLGTSTYNHFESWWAGSAINYGFIWFSVDVAVVATLYASITKRLLETSQQARPIYVGLMFQASYFVLGSFNLPFPLIFPVNILFFIFSFLVLFGKLQDNCLRDQAPTRLDYQKLSK